MSQFERLLVPGCTESPTCQCGEEMDVATIEMLPEGSDAAVRVYRCSGCYRENASDGVGYAYLTPSPGRSLVSNVPRYLGTAAFGSGGNAASVIVPRRRSKASLSARSSFSSVGT